MPRSPMRVTGVRTPDPLPVFASANPPHRVLAAHGRRVNAWAVVVDQIVCALWRGDDVGSIAQRHSLAFAEVREVAQRAGMTLRRARGRTVAIEGTGWCAVLVDGRVYERARRLPDGRVTLITSGRTAHRRVVAWSEVEAYYPRLRVGAANHTRVARWRANPFYVAPDATHRRQADGHTDSHAR